MIALEGEKGNMSLSRNDSQKKNSLRKSLTNGQRQRPIWVFIKLFQWLSMKTTCPLSLQNNPYTICKNEI